MGMSFGLFRWYDSVDQLRGMDIDILNKYMPRRLAEEVYKQLLNEASGLRTSHIASGSLDNEHRVSWNLLEVKLI